MQFFHYGSDKITVSTDASTPGQINIKSTFGGKGLDMRAAVGHITRNIKISGSEDDNWGAHIFVYHWIDPSKTPAVDARGVIILDSIELF